LGVANDENRGERTLPSVRFEVSSFALALLLGCVYQPAEIARFETSEEGADDPSHGSGVIGWDQLDLCDGATLVADLGNIDMEAVTSVGGVHHTVIEVVPIQPPTLPEGFLVSLHPLDPYAGAAFEASGTGLRYEGPLQLGWSVLLHAEEQSIVELRAQISSCETEYSPHPFVSLADADGYLTWDPACHDGFVNTQESQGNEFGYIWCSIQCEDVADCAAWDPGSSVVTCAEGECAWYCNEAHHCPSELECGPVTHDPSWGECWATYAIDGD
jgi:hypothetical protein